MVARVEQREEHLHHHRPPAPRVATRSPRFSAQETRKATLTAASWTPRGERPRKQVVERNIHTALESLPGARTKVGLGGSGREIHPGADRPRPGHADRLRRCAVEKDLRTIPGLGNVSSTASLIRPEIAVRPNFARAADLGVTSSAIAETLRVATLGDYDQSLAKLNLAQRQVPIVVKLEDSARQNLALLERLSVPGRARAGDAGPGGRSHGGRRPRP